MTGNSHTQSTLSSLNLLLSLLQFGAMLSSIIKAILHIVIIGSVNQNIIQLQLGIHGQAHDFIQICFRNLVSIFCLNQALLSIGQFHLATQHVNLSDNANLILSLYILQMVGQTVYGFTAQLLHIICLQHVEVAVSNGRTHIIIRLLQALLGNQIACLSLLNSTIQLTTGVNGHGSSQGVGVSVANLF